MGGEKEKEKQGGRGHGLVMGPNSTLLLIFFISHSLRSGYSTKDYSLTGYVWSTVNLSPEHLGHGVSLKVTVVYDSLQEPLTFTCDCKLLV